MLATLIDTPASFETSQRDPTCVMETTHCHAQEKVSKKLKVVQSLELQLEISKCWATDSVEWKETARMVVMCKYQRALDHLEGLIIARMFEMSKANHSQTGMQFGSEQQGTCILR